MYRNVRKCTDRYRNVRKCTEIYRNVQIGTEIYRYVHKYTEMYRNVQFFLAPGKSHKASWTFPLKSSKYLTTIYILCWLLIYLAEFWEVISIYIIRNPRVNLIFESSPPRALNLYYLTAMITWHFNRNTQTELVSGRPASCTSKGFFNIGKLFRFL